MVTEVAPAPLTEQVGQQGQEQQEQQEQEFMSAAEAAQEFERQHQQAVQAAPPAPAKRSNGHVPRGGGRVVEVTPHMRRPRTRVPQGETRQQKFSRLATVRTRKAIRALYQLQNLASPAYEFDAAQAEIVVEAVEGALADVRAAYRRRLHGRHRIADEVAAFSV